MGLLVVFDINCELEQLTVNTHRSLSGLGCAIRLIKALTVFVSFQGQLMRIFGLTICWAERPCPSLRRVRPRRGGQAIIAEVANGVVDIRLVVRGERDSPGPSRDEV